MSETLQRNTTFAPLNCSAMLNKITAPGDRNFFAKFRNRFAGLPRWQHISYAPDEKPLWVMAVIRGRGSPAQWRRFCGTGSNFSAGGAPSFLLLLFLP